MAVRTAQAQSGQSHHASIDQALRTLQKAEEFIKYGMQVTQDLAGDLALIDNDENGSHVGPLKATMLSYCHLQQDLKDFVKATDYIKTQPPPSGASVQTGEDLASLLDKQVSVSKGRGGNKDDPRQYNNYLAMERHIHDVLSALHDDSSLPAETEIQLDDDLAMTQTVNMKCPYTGKEMVNPYRNKHCNHSYEYEGIIEYLKTKMGRAKCPVSGCVSDRFVVIGDLEENRDLKKQIERKNRRENKK